MTQEYNLPGFGSRTKESCNTVTSADYCPDCHRVDARFYHCNNWECPECYHWTAAKAARRIADRVYGCYLAWRSFGKNLGYVNHFEFSVPESEYEGFDKDSNKAKAVAYAKDVGVSGGAVAFHPYRIKKELQRPVRLAMEAAGMKGGSWDGIHSDVLGLGDWRNYAVFGPHFHIVGYFSMKEKSNEFQKRTGWVYKNISWSKRHHAEDKDAVRRIFSYLLTHHSVSKGKQNVTYFGTASYSKVSKKSYKEKELKKCPDCSGQMYQIAIWTEERIEQIRAGTHKVVLDEFNPKSRCVVVHNFYTVRTSQATIETYYSDDDPGGLECP